MNFENGSHIFIIILSHPCQYVWYSS